MVELIECLNSSTVDERTDRDLDFRHRWRPFFVWIWITHVGPSHASRQMKTALKNMYENLWVVEALIE
tara:strand:- start:5426 stop:5629 length:204 start_codon:yes stop_codon:yes gene_type:complete